MGEEVKVKGSNILQKNRDVFYTSGVDRLARFVDRHPTQLRVSLLYCKLLILNIFFKSRYCRSSLLEGRNYKVQSNAQKSSLVKTGKKLF